VTMGSFADMAVEVHCRACVSYPVQARYAWPSGWT
jgi:hypothetical protein